MSSKHSSPGGVCRKSRIADSSKTGQSDRTIHGKAGAKRLFVDRFRAKFAGGTEGPKPGLLMEHIQLQDIIDVAPDRKTAKARFRYFMQGGTHYGTGEARQW